MGGTVSAQGAEGHVHPDPDQFVFPDGGNSLDSRACPEAFAEVAGDIDHERDLAVSVADTLAPGFVDTPTMTKL